ncbi:hypothetical protein ABBQ32_003319 [Trebouxia sp. C0010 RCD-2024]
MQMSKHAEGRHLQQGHARTGNTNPGAAKQATGDRLLTPAAKTATAVVAAATVNTLPASQGVKSTKQSNLWQSQQQSQQQSQLKQQTTNQERSTHEHRQAQQPASSYGLHQPDPTPHHPGHEQLNPIYLHGHHGAPRLEHKLSASYSNLTKALEALADGSVTSGSYLPVAGAPAMQPHQKPSRLSAVSTASLQASQTSVTAQPAASVPAKAAASATSISKGSSLVCSGCGKGGWTGRSLSALGGKWHAQCWKCAGCLQVLEGPYNTGKLDNLPYHPQCFKEAFGTRCTSCQRLVDGQYVTVEGQPLHLACFRCLLCQKHIEGSYRSSKQGHGYFHPECYLQKYGKRCTACGQLAERAAVTVEGLTFHSDCFKCGACQQPIAGQYNTDAQAHSHYHPKCYQEKFGERCSVCMGLLEGKYCSIGSAALHYSCFTCQACKLPIEGSYSTGKEDGLHYHSQCYKERFGKRCAACSLLLEGGYTQVAGRSLHHHCHVCKACKAPIVESKFKLEGVESYHSTCHREKFDPRCDVCAELLPLVSGRIEYLVAPFWKQKYCRKHDDSNTPRCCSCNRLKTSGQLWLTLSDERMVCQDCSKTVVQDTQQAQPLYDDVSFLNALTRSFHCFLCIQKLHCHLCPWQRNTQRNLIALNLAIMQVLAFFAKLGLPLRERPPMMLVDGPTLNAHRGKEDLEDVPEVGIEVPVFHTRGLCMSKVWGKLSHVAGTQRGYSQLHKQPSLDATLRPADLAARKIEYTQMLAID